MKRIIYLAELRGLPVESPYPSELVTKAREALEQARLRYDNRYGRIHSRRGELERFVRQSDHTPHENVEDVMRWEFSRHINNAASRIQRGHVAH